MLYRRFGFLQARMLLYKQAELKELETQLDDSDAIDLEQYSNVLRSQKAGELPKVGRNRQRKKLMYDIGEKFKEYGKLKSVINSDRLG